MREILCAGWFLLFSAMAWGQITWPQKAGLLSRQPLSVLAQASDPVSLLSFPRGGVGISGEKKFLLADYGEYAFALAVPEHKNGFGLAAWYGGSGLLHRTRISLGYARQLDQKLGAALQLSYHAMVLPIYYGRAAAVSARVGIAYQLTPQLKTAFHISDPFGSPFRKRGELLYAPDYSAGLGYEPSEKLYMGVHFSKEQEKAPELAIDLVYSPVNTIRLQGGIELTGDRSWIGLNWVRNNFRFGLVALLHAQTGIWPLSIVGFEPGKMVRP